ncbi:DUF3408 domain-containing protein [Phocaeicola vulgatus]|nr:DUF3408 domain-containing protein [Phocaeicola vulgatus]MDB1048332.1 DUF3408 domain-containing protein [Phocaeicola vulgatus]MDB1052801.1 DUF3408 domain-containing protein [Phocaeicola vulgatus]
MAGSDAMKKLLQQSAQRKEQEIQSINNVAENTSTVSEKPVKENVEEKAAEEKPVVEATAKSEPEPVEKKTPEAPQGEKQEAKEEKEKEKVGEKKFADYLIDNKVKNGEVIRISNEAHSKLKKISIATGVGMNVIATNILDDILNQHTKEIQALLKKYMNL